VSRMVARENSQAAEDKDPKAVRPDLVGKRRLAEHIVEDRPDPAPQIERDQLERGADMDRYLGDLGDLGPVTEGGGK